MTPLVPGQIVVLECRQRRLYAEVIQVLSDRPMGWIRPLALVGEDNLQILGLGEIVPTLVPDMVWPLDQMQPALDTEVIPLVTALGEKTTAPLATGHDRHATAVAVGDFLRMLWADRTAPQGVGAVEQDRPDL